MKNCSPLCCKTEEQNNKKSKPSEKSNQSKNLFLGLSFFCHLNHQIFFLIIKCGWIIYKVMVISARVFFGKLRHSEMRRTEKSGKISNLHYFREKKIMGQERIELSTSSWLRCDADKPQRSYKTGALS